VKCVLKMFCLYCRENDNMEESYFIYIMQAYQNTYYCLVILQQN